MGRKAKYQFTIQGGKIVGYNFKANKGHFTAVFKHPTEDEKYVQHSTGVEVPKGWQPWKDVPADIHTEVAKAVVKWYSPTLPPDPKTATWEAAMKDLEEHEHLRPRAWEVYVSILNVFRATIPGSTGPGDVTLETAKQFKKLYSTTPFKRSTKDDAKGYKRSPKTVENSLRRLSGLWEKLTPKYVSSNPWELIDRPTVPDMQPVVPTEDDVDNFFKWLDARYPEWNLPRLFVEVKALSGCRLNDLCQIKSDQLDPTAHTLTIRPDQDKTHRERTIPLPADLSAKLNEVKGETYLWERYLEDSKKWRPGTRSKFREQFEPKLMYHGMQNIFREYAEQGGKLRSHGLRKRAITLMTLATQNVDQTAAAIGVSAQTARKHYLEAKRAFDGAELLKKMADVLRPKGG
ncbi:tyrosine-type recombinase/integrase [Gemmata sp.]|uniref:tyrosine-type recombinase/integrase n=1 Tax=Gemmata sp. TaxID=1914242 RepID=UPI003F7147F3